MRFTVKFADGKHRYIFAENINEAYWTAIQIADNENVDIEDVYETTAEKIRRRSRFIKI